jgi:S1-C subfamily serine protease
MIRKTACTLLLVATFAAMAAERRPYFGLSFSFHRTETSGTFLRLCAVAPNGPAARAGLKAGDLITHIAGKRLAFADHDAALRHFATIKPNDRVKLRVARGAQVFDAVVVIAGR